MITSVVYDTDRTELGVLEELFHKEAAYLTADEWNMDFLQKLEELKKILVQQGTIDILCLDITQNSVLQALMKIREQYGETKLLLVADMQISPMEYLRPGIRPDALLLRPTDAEKMEKVLKELFQIYMEQTYRKEKTGSFTVETREGRTILPYEKIWYFEAREKKIFVRSGRKEYGFYDTVEHLLEILPDEFIRCHRGFIVNKKKVRKVVLSDNILEMENGESIPVSRTYRAEVKKL